MTFADPPCDSCRIKIHDAKVGLPLCTAVPCMLATRVTLGSGPAPAPAASAAGLPRPGIASRRGGWWIVAPTRVGATIHHPRASRNKVVPPRAGTRNHDAITREPWLVTPRTGLVAVSSHF
jgi:hypothetical protein